ncbi:MAG: hypothetical protein ABIG85_00405 [Chloroflexota bacterium]
MLIPPDNVTATALDVTTWPCDGGYRLTSVADAAAGGAVSRHTDFTFDALGRETDARTYQGAGTPAVGAPRLGFSSFGAAKRALGSARPGAEWHHVVEQNPANLAPFGARAIHNTNNLAAIDAGVHRAISGYYSTKSLPFTGGLTVRQWLGSQSWDDQYRFGVQVLSL